MGQSKLDLLQGTLDVMVLQTLEAMGPQHGYGVARRIEQVSGNEVLLNQGTIYASLVRLQQRGWIAAKWGTSDNNRKAKFYSITKTGQKQLVQDTAYWQRWQELWGAFSPCRAKEMNSEAFPSRSIQASRLFLPQRSTRPGTQRRDGLASANDRGRKHAPPYVCRRSPPPGPCPIWWSAAGA